ncbi:non-LEE encoded effector protein NleB [Escherichia coli O111:H8 str. CFSAN001632]|nr:non-LEE encoded effector protein NleB [Escherichia coli O111:H8 str. CFSAN001632]
MNTKEHPYLSNIINAAKIENERIIGVLGDGNFTYEQKRNFSVLKMNIKI